MKLIVGVGDMKLSTTAGDVLVTHSLGSCVGVAVYDAEVGVGGLLHYQLPDSTHEPEKRRETPYMYAASGIPALFRAAYALGAEKKRITVKVAGGAKIMDKNGFFSIGERNVTAMRKLFWKNGVFIAGEDTGGESWRTMRLDMATGAVWIKTKDSKYEI